MSQLFCFDFSFVCLIPVILASNLCTRPTYRGCTKPACPAETEIPPPRKPWTFGHGTRQSRDKRSGSAARQRHGAALQAARKNSGSDKADKHGDDRPVLSSVLGAPRRSEASDNKPPKTKTQTKRARAPRRPPGGLPEGRMAASPPPLPARPLLPPTSSAPSSRMSLVKLESCPVSEDRLPPTCPSDWPSPEPSPPSHDAMAGPSPGLLPQQRRGPAAAWPAGKGGGRLLPPGAEAPSAQRCRPPPRPLSGSSPPPPALPPRRPPSRLRPRHQRGGRRRPQRPRAARRGPGRDGALWGTGPAGRGAVTPTLTGA